MKSGLYCTVHPALDLEWPPSSDDPDIPYTDYRLGRTFFEFISCRDGSFLGMPFGYSGIEFGRSAILRQVCQ